jgi:predicted PurR-regulated permease PerM
MAIVLACYAASFVLNFLGQIRGVVYVVIGAVFFAYLIYPVVHRLRRFMPLVLAIVVTYAAIAVVLISLGWYVVPRLTEDVGTFLQRYPELAARVNDAVFNPHDPLTSRLPAWVRNEIARIPDELAAWVKQRGLESFGRVMILLAGGFAALATFVLIPLLTAYLLMDLEHLKDGLSAVVPPRRWRAALEFLSDVDGVVGGFIRGQLLVALSVGVLITFALLLLHVPYAFLFGLLAAVGDLVPYVGAVLAFVPAFTVAWTNNGLVNALLVLAAFVVIFEAEGHFLAPNIVSKTVRLSPFVVLLALLIGGELGGIVGLLVAIPVMGILRVIALRVFPASGANEPKR